MQTLRNEKAMTKILGKYQIHEELGRGGFIDVYTVICLLTEGFSPNQCIPLDLAHIFSALIRSQIAELLERYQNAYRYSPDQNTQSAA